MKIMLKNDETKEEIKGNNAEVVMEGIVLPLSNSFLRFASPCSRWRNGKSSYSTHI